MSKVTTAASSIPDEEVEKVDDVKVDDAPNEDDKVLPEDESEFALDESALEKPADAEVEISADAEEYELELKEDSILDEETFDEVVKYANDHNLTKAQAEALLSQTESRVKKSMESTIESTVTNYKKELYSDPMFNTKEKVQAASKNINVALASYKDAGLIKALKEDKNLANNVHVLKLLATIGANLAKSGSGPATQSPTAKVDPKKEKGFYEEYPHLKGIV